MYGNQSINNYNKRAEYSSDRDIESAGPDNIYFNAIFSGPDNTIDFDASSTSIAEFNITRTVPILQKCSDYYCSIVRFNISLDLIPILVMPIIPGCDTYAPPPVTPRNITTFIVAIEYGGVVYTANNGFLFGAPGGPTDYHANVIWTPENYDFPVTFQTLLTQQIITQYTYMYWYDTLITMVNTTLAAAYAAFQLANPLVPQAVANVAPFFYFDSTTQLMSLVAHQSWITTPAQFVPNPPLVARVCMNIDLSVFFDGFKTLSLGSPAIPVLAQNEVQFVIEDLGYNGYPTNTYPALSTFVYIRQNYNVINFWASLRKLVITTNTIPIVSECVPVGSQETSNASYLPIISDFVPELNASGDARSVAYYNPTAQYRLVDMIKDTPLNTIDLKIFWQDKADNLFPLEIVKYQQCQVKLGFFKKSLYKSNGRLLK